MMDFQCARKSSMLKVNAVKTRLTGQAIRE